MKKCELLSPAGSIQRLEWAFLYGADAVYMGGYKYNLRANAKNFSMEELKQGCLIAKAKKKKVYVTVNFIFHNDDIDGLVLYLKELENIGVDAIIISDLFILKLLKENSINLPVHVSTQLSTLNSEAIKFLADEGVERVILGRELTLDELKDIVKNTKVQIETFIHGATCSGYSGRCVLSNYLTNRDANRGGCSQVCRFDFDIYDDNKIVNDKKFTCATKDLSLITRISDMIKLGITSFKIEGRMRSNYYIATVVSTYRQVIDDYYNNTLTEDKINEYKLILDRCANRDSSEHFIKGYVDETDQYYNARSEITNQDFLGIVIKYDEYNKKVYISQRNCFKKGDEVVLFGPNHKKISLVIPSIYNDKGQEVDIANHPEEIINFTLKEKVNKNDIMRVKF